MKKYAATDTTTVSRPSWNDMLVLMSKIGEKIHDDEDPPPTAQPSDPPHFGKHKRLKLRERSIEDGV